MVKSKLNKRNSILYLKNSSSSILHLAASMSRALVNECMACVIGGHTILSLKIKVIYDRNLKYMLMLPYNYFTCHSETNWSISKTVIVISNNLDTVAQLFCFFYTVSPVFSLFQWKYDLIDLCSMLWFNKSSYT